MRHRSTDGPGKLYRRILVKCAALVALTVAVANSFAATAWAITVYDRAAAVAYADKYANIVVSDGYFWVDSGTCLNKGAGTPVPTGAGVAGGVGDDCAHFVSSAIGSESHEKGGGLPVPSPLYPSYLQYGNPSASGITNWVLSNYGTQVTSVSSLTPGDLIAYDWDGGGSIDHVVLYTGNNKIDAHAASHKEVGWNLAGSSYPNAKFTFVHVTALGYAPGTPTNNSPPTTTSLTPTLAGSAFANTNLGGKQVAAEWSIRNGLGISIYDSGTDTAHLTSVSVPAGKLIAGTTYTWQVRYEDNYEDWSSYSTATNLSIGFPTVAGDYDLDGVVDASDYLVWRKNLGTTNVLPNDPTGGVIRSSQYSTWRSHIGQTGGSGAGASFDSAVPEPTSLVLLLAAAAGAVMQRRGSRLRSIARI